MSTKAVPSIPPRPSRSSGKPSPGSSHAGMPRIPPRPHRRTSPNDEKYAPSPLNDPPSAQGLPRTTYNESPPSNPPSRPPSVNLPSLGEEGMEYEGIEQQAREPARMQEPAETRNVDRGLHLHAPKPSLPAASAKMQVKTVTSTTSQQAAAAGIGKVTSPELTESERFGRSMHSKTNGSRHESSTASSNRRRESIQFADEHGIPEIGQRVPMYPNAGDVQAPSPAPFAAENGHSASPAHRSGRGHSRTRSGRESSLPPGSYGLHGHGSVSNDRFEKAWYEKHPDALAREEQGQYGPSLSTPRPEWVMSSDELNNIVRSSAGRGTGLGTSAEFMGTPEEEVGYIASAELASRLASPSNVAHSVKSPLHQTSFPESSERQGEEKEEVEIHIDEPLHHQHHPDGFAPAPEEHTSPELSGEGAEAEHEDEAPILAADEVHPGAENLQPAVSPTFDRRPSSHGPESESHHVRTPSGGNHRPGFKHSVTAPVSVRFSDDHLADVEEYEPLFPEDEEPSPEKEKEDKFKSRPARQQHRFPSRDIWEDAPDSLQLETTVTTPDTPRRPRGEGVNEIPEEEEIDRTKLMKSKRPATAAPSYFPSTKPAESAKQRFPSRDIWEDAPDSHRLVTTVQQPEASEQETSSPVVPERPAVPSSRPKRTVKSPPQEGETKIAAVAAESRKPPSIPERPKPQVPGRPARKGTDEESPTDTTSKAKPAVPARPGGPKIASLKSGFLSDLNNRLKIGPKPPPTHEKNEEAEVPEDKGPLSDARKGRARGPVRRKPAVAAQVPQGSEVVREDGPEIKLVDPWNVWRVVESGTLIVGREESEPAEAAEPAAAGGSASNAAEDFAPKAAEPESPVAKALVDPQEVQAPLDEVRPSSSDDTHAAVSEKADIDIDPSSVPEEVAGEDEAGGLPATRE